MTEVEELKKELEKIQSESKAKSEFLSMVTHQLRTPLSGLKWIFQMQMSGDLGTFTDEQKKIIEKGAASNQRMLNLLQEVMDANHQDTWDFNYKFSKIDIIHIIKDLILELLEEARVKNITLNLHDPESPLPLIEADPEKISIVFQNILENAVKYTDEGGSVIIDIEDAGESIIVSFKDDGIGIPEEAQDNIFDKFFRSDNAKEKVKEGTGLGLFTAKKIVERHNGKLWFESKKDKGTTFFCEFPKNQ